MSGKTYVDGGVVSPVAVDVARRYGADVVIAVDISGCRRGRSTRDDGYYTASHRYHIMRR